MASHLAFSEAASYYAQTALIGLSMPISVFVYYLIYKRKSMREIVGALGLGLKAASPRNIGLGLMAFLLIFTFTVIVNLASSITGTKINTNVGLLLGNGPFWFYLFVAFIEPINEEILFRGFLVPRLGIVFSALLFGAAHAGYNSTFGVEIIAAAIFGLVAGHIFKKTESLYPSIIAHTLVNTMGILAALS